MYKGTLEAEVISELQEIGGYHLINKNSTNGFIEPEFQQWLKENQNINTYIITEFVQIYVFYSLRYQLKRI